MARLAKKQKQARNQKLRCKTSTLRSKKKKKRHHYTIVVDSASVSQSISVRVFYFGIGCTFIATHAAQLLSFPYTLLPIPSLLRTEPVRADAGRCALCARARSVSRAKGGMELNRYVELTRSRRTPQTWESLHLLLNFPLSRPHVHSAQPPSLLSHCPFPYFLLSLSLTPLSFPAVCFCVLSHFLYPLRPLPACLSLNISSPVVCFLCVCYLALRMRFLGSSRSLGRRALLFHSCRCCRLILNS